MDVQTDACYEAAGAFFRGNWAYYNFSMELPSLSALHINYKEVMAMVVAITKNDLILNSTPENRL